MTKQRRRPRIRLRPAAVILILIAAVAVVVALTVGGKRDVKATAQGETPQPAAPATEVVAEIAEPTRMAALLTVDLATGWIYDAEPSAQTIAAVEDALLHPETWVLAFAVGHLHDSWATPVEEIETPWETTEVFYTFKY